MKYRDIEQYEYREYKRNIRFSRLINQVQENKRIFGDISFSFQVYIQKQFLDCDTTLLPIEKKPTKQQLEGIETNLSSHATERVEERLEKTKTEFKRCIRSDCDRAFLRKQRIAVCARKDTGYKEKQIWYFSTDLRPGWGKFLSTAENRRIYGNIHTLTPSEETEMREALHARSGDILPEELDVFLETTIAMVTTTSMFLLNTAFTKLITVVARTNDTKYMDFQTWERTGYRCRKPRCPRPLNICTEEPQKQEQAQEQTQTQTQTQEQANEQTCIVCTKLVSPDLGKPKECPKCKTVLCKTACFAKHKKKGCPLRNEKERRRNLNPL